MRYRKYRRQKPICYLCVAVIMAAVMLSGCSSDTDAGGQSSAPVTASEVAGDVETVSSAAESADENVRGNTVGNLVNRGLVAQQGDWIYYSNEVDSEDYPDAWGAASNAPPIFSGIFKSRLDGTEKTYITYVPNAVFINVIGEWIYYIDGGVRAAHAAEELWQGAVYKIRTDGTEKTQLTEADCWYMSAVGSFIYYANVSDGGRIYKMRTDGSENTRINDDESVCLNVVDGWIYYVNQSDGDKIYKIRTDGTERTKLNDDESAYLNAVNGWIYYSNKSDSSKIYKVRIDGTERTKLCDDENCSYVNVTGDRVYYQLNIETKTTSQFNGVLETHYCEAWNLCSMSADGTEQVLLCKKEDSTGAGSLGSKFWNLLYVVEDEPPDLYVYRYGLGVSKYPYKVPADGTEPQRVE